MQKTAFLVFLKLLEILILKHIPRVPPCEISRPDNSDKVEVIGSGSFLMCQSPF